MVGAVLTAAPAVVARSGDNVTVSWRGVANASSLDWIAAYAPPGTCAHTHDVITGYRCAGDRVHRVAVGGCGAWRWYVWCADVLRVRRTRPGTAA